MTAKSSMRGSTKAPVPVLVQRKLDELAMRATVARKARRLTQQDLAHLADVGVSTVASIERGHDGVALGNLVKVLSALELLEQVDALFNLSHDPELVNYGLARLKPAPIDKLWRPKPAAQNE